MDKERIELNLNEDLGSNIQAGGGPYRLTAYQVQNDMIIAFDIQATNREVLDRQ